MIKISIIIPTLNKKTRLQLTLDSLISQNISKNNFEVIIVNGGKEEYWEKQYPFKKTFINIKEHNIAKARNIGAKYAMGDILLFIDDDMLLPKGFLLSHLNAQVSMPSIVHGEIRNLYLFQYFKDPITSELYMNIEVSPKIKKILEKFEVNEANIRKGDFDGLKKYSKKSGFELLIENSFRLNKSCKWISFTGGNVSLPRVYFEKVKGFDENFGSRWGCEDIELGYRLLKNGYTFVYSHDAINYHMDHENQNRRQEHNINTDYFYFKHGEKKIYLIQKYLENNINLKQIMELL